MKYCLLEYGWGAREMAELFFPVFYQRTGGAERSSARYGCEK